MDAHSRTFPPAGHRHRGVISFRAIAALLATALVVACGYGGDAALVNDEGAILDAIGTYLKEQRGINPDSMEMTLSELNLEGDRAHAVVRFSSQDAPTGMEYEYQLQRTGEAWSVVASSSTGEDPESLPEGHPPIPAPEADDAGAAGGTPDDAS